ncbi:wax ester/triacylglycerol synthase domain-containing protein [Nonomuraea sp. NPDC048826]|uniref:wax ester/triacylglycerol synthase domain-containing protein n=1 Tax=Nonomuraea sp. NPDC048826 TaxID=3364347 RepID=UPI00371B9788
MLLEPRARFEVARASRLLAAWARSVPRLRRRLVRVPIGCGRPVWVDDPVFGIRLHVREMTRPAPGDERALLDVAAAVLTAPRPRHSGRRSSSPDCSTARSR